MFTPPISQTQVVVQVAGSDKQGDFIRMRMAPFTSLVVPVTFQVALAAAVAQWWSGVLVTRSEALAVEVRPEHTAEEEVVATVAAPAAILPTYPTAED